MIYHVLPGDAQVNDFRETGIEGEVLICREALIDGDVSGDTLEEFFNNRAAFVNEFSGDQPFLYKANVASQFRRLLKAIDRDEVNLWFEYELFCAVNMWFCLSLLHGSGADIYRVSPSHLNYDDRWNGFANTNPEILSQCFENRVKLDDSDVRLGTQLWDAFRRRDSVKLVHLTSGKHDAYPYLEEVVQAAADLDTRPAEIVGEIKREGANDLKTLFPEFRRRAGVYGFGDLQVKRLMENA